MHSGSNKVKNSYVARSTNIKGMAVRREVSKLRCQKWGVNQVSMKFIGLGLFSSRSALKGVLAITYCFTLFFGLGFYLIHFFPFAFILFFWLGSAVDHRPHIPITTHFQYTGAGEHRHKETEKTRETE